MKKHYLLVFLFSFPALMLFGQLKTTFGLVVKTGNYMLPSEKNLKLTYFYNTTVTQKHQAGMSYIFGIFQKLQFGKHFGVSAELLYRFNDYSFSAETKSRHTDPFIEDDADIYEGLSVNENSISLPVKFHVSFLKNHRTSLALGAGISRIFSTEKVKTTQVKHFYRPELDSHETTLPSRNNLQDFGNVLTMTAGLYHQLAENTTIGLEFNFERNRAILKGAFPEFNGDSDISAYGYIYSSMKLPNLQSFAILLQHNLFR